MVPRISWIYIIKNESRNYAEEVNQRGKDATEPKLKRKHKLLPWKL